MKQITSILLAGSAAIFMTACGGGGSSTDYIPQPTDTTPPSDVNANGLWAGVQTIDGVEYDIQAIIYDNRIVGYSVEGLSMFAGDSSINGDTLKSNYRAYDDYGDYVISGVLTGTVVENTSLTANFDNNLGQSGTINASFDAQYNISSSLSKIEGQYTSSTQNFTITNGVISGVTNGCDIQGSVIVPDTTVNVYDIEYTLNNCAYDGTYNGLGTITTNSNGTFIQAGMSKSNRMDLFVAQILDSTSSYSTLKDLEFKTLNLTEYWHLIDSYLYSTMNFADSYMETTDGNPILLDDLNTLTSTSGCQIAPVEVKEFTYMCLKVYSSGSQAAWAINIDSTGNVTGNFEYSEIGDSTELAEGVLDRDLADAWVTGTVSSYDVNTSKTTDNQAKLSEFDSVIPQSFKQQSNNSSETAQKLDEMYNKLMQKEEL